MFGNLLSDIRYVIRIQRRSPAFAVATVLTLALGIGANTAIFSLLDRVVLQALPVHEPERLFTLGIANQADAATPLVLFSFPFFEDLHAENEVFSHMLAYRTSDVTLSTATGGERIRVTYVTDDYFNGLGVGAAIGRPLVPQDNQGSSGVAVLSYPFWQRRFSGDPSIVGLVIRVNNNPVTVIGVAPRGFFGTQLGTSTDVWMPLPHMPGVAGQLLQLRSAMSLSVIVRLKPGVTREQAEASISSLWRSLPPAQAGPAVALQQQPLLLLPGTRALSSLQRQFGEPLWALMGLVGFVLLIMCANLSSLLIVRALGRRGEIATRAALGASRLRIIQPLLIESLLFSICGMACGVVGAYWAVDKLLTFLPANRFALDVEPSGTGLAFSVTLTLVLSLLLGILPATQLIRLDLRSILSMEESGTVAGGLHRFGLRQLLVVGQVALSVVLAIGAGLFVRSLNALESVDSGLRGERVLQMALDPAAAGYPQPAAIQFYTRVLDTVHALPGVQSAAFATLPPLGTVRARDNFFPGGYVPRQGQDNASLLSFVSPDIFRTLGIPLLRGREFTERDDANAPTVIIVNEPYAKRFFGNRDAIGQRIGNGGVPQFEIVGIVGATKFSDLREEPPLMVFRPAAQFRFASERTLYVRTAGDPGTSIEPVRAAVRGLDPNVPLSEVKTFADQVDETLVQEQLTATLSSWFGGLALFLMGLGLYGLVNYNMIRRRRDFALRLVLGASPTSLMGAIMREALIPVGLGTAVGIAVALPLSRSVGTLLFDITPMDIRVVIAAAITINAVAIIAAAVPAWRARQVDPVRVLRAN